MLAMALGVGSGSRWWWNGLDGCRSGGCVGWWVVTSWCAGDGEGWSAMEVWTVKVTVGWVVRLAAVCSEVVRSGGLRVRLVQMTSRSRVWLSSTQVRGSVRVTSIGLCP